MNTHDACRHIEQTISALAANDRSFRDKLGEDTSVKIVAEPRQGNRICVRFDIEADADKILGSLPSAVSR